MKINKLVWDSNFFNLKIGESSSENISWKEDITDFDLIYVKQKNPEDFVITGFDKKFQETKIIFTKDLRSSQKYILETSILDFDENLEQNQLFYDLAFVSGNYSRFFLDENFGRKKFQELYRTWIDNSITKEIADKIFYIFQEDKISGFVTLQKKEDFAIIGLIAVDPKIQGQGIGSKLLKMCEKYCVEQGLYELRIPTQEENWKACKFYKNMGYAVLEKMSIKHYWKRPIKNKGI